MNRKFWIFFEDGEFVEWLTARRVGEEITEWYGPPVEVVGRFPASVYEGKDDCYFGVK